MGSPAEKLEVPRAVREIADRLEKRGFETWAVGGAVRDALLGVYRSDWDLATAARPDTVRKLFRPSYPIGIQFGTVGVRGSDGRVYEITTFRRDIATDGRHAVVEYAERVDDDLARRDFTINAVAYHPLRHEVYDPFAGREDLQRRVLRCVGQPEQRFAEDYLRVLRGLRFAGRYGLEIEAATWTALKEAVARLPQLSGERVREELLKTLAGPGASCGLTLYQESGALAVLLPELAELGESRWTEVVSTIDSLPPARFRLRLAALFAPAGEGIQGLMIRLRFANVEIRDVVALAGAVAVPLPEGDDPVAGRRWLHDIRAAGARDTLRLQFARARARRLVSAERAKLAARARLLLQLGRRGEAVQIADLAIDGNDLKALGLRPGPDFGRILERCLEAVIEDPKLNTRERLIELVREQL